MAKKQISLLGQFDSLLRYALNMEIFVQFKFRHIASFRLVKLMQYSTKVKLRRKSTVNFKKRNKMKIDIFGSKKNNSFRAITVSLFKNKKATGYL